MKPLNISMQAFGPFTEKVEIDFTKLGENGLFLISGATGAGKTTIFDGISFALYGKASGKEREGSMLRSDFAPQQTETVVELRFLFREQEYTVTRSMRQRKNSGTLEPKASLILPGGDIVLGISNVNSFIEQLIGISKEQFSQVVMIAQNDFMKLVISSTDQRSEILRRIFETSKFRDLGELLRQKAAGYSAELDRDSTKIEQYANGILCSGSTGPATAVQQWQQSMDLHDLGGLLELLKALTEEQGAQQTAASDTVAKLQQNQKEQAAQISKAQDQQKMAARLTQLREELQKLENSSKQYLELENGIARAKSALEVRAYEEPYTIAKGELAQLEASIETQKNAIAQAEAALKQAQQAMDKDLENQPERAKLAEQISALEKAMPQYNRLHQARLNLEAAISEAAGLDKEHKELAEDTSSSKLLLEKLTEETQQFINLETVIEKQNNHLKQLEATNITLESAANQHQKIMSLQAELAETQNLYNKLEHQYNEANKDFLDIESRFYRGQAGLLAQSLVNGKPCPVCGSSSHPNPAGVSADIPTKEQFDAARINAENRRNALSKSSGECSAKNASLESETTAFEKTFASITKANPKLFSDVQYSLQTAKENLDNAKNKITFEIAEAEKELDKLNGNLTLLDENKNKMVLLQRNIQENEKSAADILAKLHRLDVSKSGLEAEIKTLHAGLEASSAEEAQILLENAKTKLEEANLLHTSIKSALQNAQSSLEAHAAVLKERESARKAQNIKCAAALDKFEKSVAQKGFSDSREYQSHLVSKEDLEKQEKVLNDYLQNKTSLAGEINLLEKETGELPDINLPALQEQLSQTEALLSEANEAYAELHSKNSTNKQTLQQLEQLHKRRAKLEHKYMLCKNLSDTANGQLKDKDRITFETYVQSAYYSQILNAANLRLEVMASGRYRLARRSASKDRRSKTGLELEVLDMANLGKPRDVKTLSGGESFKAALSLALGLSDVVQQNAGGIKLDAMFVDEGFGSLDAESLDAAINALQNLAGENRIVGIISHVSELANRIDRKVIVEKATGTSRIHIEY